jgi:beta-carotene hydroxylase
MNRGAGNPIDPSLFQTPLANLQNPTIWVFVCAVVVYGASTALFLSRVTPRAATAIVAVACLYCLYTVSHEAAHGNAHPNRRVNAWLGRLAAAIEGMTFPLFRIIHLQHHAFTNDPARDPDFVIGRQPRWLLPVWTIARLTHDNGFMVRNGLWSGRRPQLREHLLTMGIQGAAVTAGILVGGVEFVLWAWVGPVIVAGALLELTVAWAVHYPHQSQHPLENTRVFRGKLLQVLTLNQSYHLVHHLWPRIPWFRYTLAADAAELAVAQHQRGVESPRMS